MSASKCNQSATEMQPKIKEILIAGDHLHDALIYGTLESKKLSEKLLKIPRLDLIPSHGISKIVWPFHTLGKAGGVRFGDYHAALSGRRMGKSIYSLIDDCSYESKTKKPKAFHNLKPTEQIEFINNNKPKAQASNLINQLIKTNVSENNRKNKPKKPHHDVW